VSAAITRRAGGAGLLALLGGCATTSVSKLSTQDQSDVARVQSYLDRLHGLRARFMQIGPDGASSTGIVWYDPGRLHLQYDAPNAMLVVAAGQHLVAHRESDDSTTRIALSGNPLGLLLEQPLRLSGKIGVTDVQRGPGILQISLARAANPAQGLLTLIFSDQADGLTLAGLEAVDAHRNRTRLRLADVQAGLALDPALFKYPSS
jgi:outer membrane lipoprotein-sorting protein